MKARGISIFIMIVFIFCFSGNAFSYNYSVKIASIMQNNIESAETFYRVYFRVFKDGNMIQPWERDEITRFELSQMAQNQLLGNMVWDKNPSIGEKPIDEIVDLWSYRSKNFYDAKYSSFIFQNPSFDQSEPGKQFRIDVSKEEFENTFDVNNSDEVYFYAFITTSDGIVIQSTIPFKWNGLIELPVILSNSIKRKYTKTGDMIIEWEGIDGSFGMNYNGIEKNGGTSIRCRFFLENKIIEVQDPNREDGPTYPVKYSVSGEVHLLPVHMEKVFIPNFWLEIVKKKYDNFDFSIQLRTNDGINRYHPDQIQFQLK